MDTDSFIFETDENFEDIMLEHKELFDLSDYPKDSEYYCSDNKKVPEKVRNERISFPVYEGIYLKSKSYSIISKNSEECKHKGHSYNFKSSDYKYVLHNKQILEENSIYRSSALCSGN